VVKLLSGRLNLFTTSFSLDPDAPNVAIFTPSLGLVP
jgi:translocation and assembly module TamB